MSDQSAILNATDVQYVSTGDLAPHPRNPRQGDLGAIIESIRENGFYGALVAQRSSGRVLAGNHRLLAAAELGIAEVPVIYLDVNDDEALRILLTDNRTNDLAAYDDASLARLLQDLAEESERALAGTGYDADDLDALLSSLNPDWDDAMGALPDGDREPYQQMTFTLHDQQVEAVKAALAAAQADDCDSDLNSNSNGNALAHIAEAYTRGR